VIDASAAEFIVATARRHPGEVTLVPVGRLTNLALALALEPRLPQLVKEVILMGGSASAGGNVTPVAEANIWGDPHAADAVFAAPWKVTMVGLDVTQRVLLDDARLERMAARDPRVGGFVYRISRFYKRFHEQTGVTGGFYVHDPSAVAYAIDRASSRPRRRACVSSPRESRSGRRSPSPGREARSGRRLAAGPRRASAAASKRIACCASSSRPWPP
jgi:inosine-uridine nucleoside N-ribohydrolase